MKRIAFEVTYPPPLVHPVHRRLMASPDLDCAELLMWGPTADVTVLFRFDGGLPAVRALLADVEFVTASNLVAGDEGTYAFLRQSAYQFSRPLLSLIDESRVIFLPPVTFHDSGLVAFEAAGASAHLRAFYEGLAELGEASIDRVHDFERRLSSGELTGRQRRALEAAVEAGYYEVPRTGSVADVASALDCAPSTAGELLRKGESAVVRDYTGA